MEITADGDCWVCSCSVRLSGSLWVLALRLNVGGGRRVKQKRILGVEKKVCEGRKGLGRSLFFSFLCKGATRTNRQGKILMVNKKEI